jgi:peroxiredoxin
MLALALALTLVSSDTTPGTELVGKPAPAWQASDWMNSPALSLTDLQGKVVLVRWFTSKECPYCNVTAPALNQLDDDFRAKGLVVVGMYHHKDDEHPLDIAKVRSAVVEDYGFKFPVAVDRDWRTLHRWWLDARKRDFTSVSFLIDKKGVIRRVHPGGAMTLGSKDYREMRGAIERLLAQ